MSLQHTLRRKLLRHANFYNNEVVPLFRSTPRFAVQAYCLRDNKELLSAITTTTTTTATGSNSGGGGDSNGNCATEYPLLADVMRKSATASTTAITAAATPTTLSVPSAGITAPPPAVAAAGSSVPLAMQSLRQLALWQRRMRASAQHRLADANYAFEVGDIVQHAELQHIGVVAAKLPIVFESDEWILENLGSLNDYRLTQPWYLLLVARHDPLPYDFVRYGSQLTHVAGPCEPIGCHRMLPMFFSGFCRETGRYIPREAHIARIAQRRLDQRRAAALDADDDDFGDEHLLQGCGADFAAMELRTPALPPAGVAAPPAAAGPSAVRSPSPSPSPSSVSARHPGAPPRNLDPRIAKALARRRRTSPTADRTPKPTSTCAPRSTRARSPKSSKATLQ